MAYTTGGNFNKILLSECNTIGETKTGEYVNSVDCKVTPYGMIYAYNIKSNYDDSNIEMHFGYIDLKTGSKYDKTFSPYDDSINSIEAYEARK